MPVAVGAVTNQAGAAGSIGAGAQVVPLRYAAAKDLAKMLEPYVGEGGKIAADPARNALLVSGSEAVRQTLVGLIQAFDTDILAGRSYALFPVGNGGDRPSSRTNCKKSSGPGRRPADNFVQVLPMERVNAVLVVSAQPRYIDDADRFFRLGPRGSRTRRREPGTSTTCRTARAPISKACCSGPSPGPRFADPAAARQHRSRRGQQSVGLTAGPAARRAAPRA